MSDWISNAADQWAQAIRPTPGLTVGQTPPDFRWPDVIASGSYTLTLTFPDTHSETQSCPGNYCNWPAQLPAGAYSWSVTYAGGPASDPRSFTVGAGATPFVVPSTATLRATLVGKAHPRTLPDASALSAIASQRAGGIASLLSSVTGLFNQALPAEGSSVQDAQNYSDYALSACMAAVFSNDSAYFDDAARRLVNLAGWNPSGATGYLLNGELNYSMDAHARKITWVLCYGYDWLYSRLNPAQRTALLTCIRARMTDMVGDLVGNRTTSLARFPRQSHQNITLHYAGLIAAVLVGDHADFDGWLTSTLPLALNANSAWADEDSGFANSACQGNWDTGDITRSWNLLRNACGLDMGDKATVGHWGRYFTYFTPPGMAGGSTVFGDGAEVNESYSQALYFTGYTHFKPSPLGRWHAAQLSGAVDQQRFDYLLSPPADFSGPQPFPGSAPAALYLPGVGQAAMHSDLSDLARTSVYFKSSPWPFGSYNHSHADHNSFVVNAGGQRLAIESGYYIDGYGTNHWRNWYHQTKAKNAITVDNGIGQIFYDDGNGVQGYGQITSFVTTPTHDVVTGDATGAYGGVLTLARRTLIYLRPNLIVVHDKLASATSRRWEWNIHALNAMSVSSGSNILISQGGQTLRVTVLAGPAHAFAQTNVFSAPTGVGPAQWHGQFYSTANSSATEFITLLNVGDTNTPASATPSDGGWQVTVGQESIAIAADGSVSVGTPSYTASGSASVSAASSASAGFSSLGSGSAVASASDAADGVLPLHLTASDSALALAAAAHNASAIYLLSAGLVEPSSAADSANSLAGYLCAELAPASAADLSAASVPGNWHEAHVEATSAQDLSHASAPLSLADDDAASAAAQSEQDARAAIAAAAELIESISADDWLLSAVPLADTATAVALALDTLSAVRMAAPLSRPVSLPPGVSISTRLWSEEVALAEAAGNFSDQGDPGYEFSNGRRFKTPQNPYQ
jgi:hypothetical protein